MDTIDDIKMNNKEFLHQIFYYFANDEILRIKIIRSYVTKIVIMTLYIMRYHVRPTYRDSFNYTWAK